jgi:hypothetical protein
MNVALAYPIDHLDKIHESIFFHLFPTRSISVHTMQLCVIIDIYWKLFGTLHYSHAHKMSAFGSYNCSLYTFAALVSGSWTCVSDILCGGIQFILLYTSEQVPYIWVGLGNVAATFSLYTGNLIVLEVHIYENPPEENIMHKFQS